MNPGIIALDPMFRPDPVRWKGLPDVTTEQLDALFGSPEQCHESLLGYYPAKRCLYTDEAGDGIVVWARDGRAVMVESIMPPPIEVLAELPEPSAMLAHEILLPDAYAHEYLYCATGLILTVAQAADSEQANWIVRCRGIRPLDHVEEFGPEYYRAFEDRVSWGS